MAEPLPSRPPRRSAAEIWRSIDLPGTDRDPNTVLDDVTVERLLVQDFRPVVESLEWELSADYWATQGLTPFLKNEVPYVVNNSGWASYNAAEVLFANCGEADALGERIPVLELGAGLGLFAREFLDAFRRLCGDHGRDYYDRLVYCVTDGSPRTVEQWRDAGLFSDHADHVVTACCNALQPTLPTDLADRFLGASRWQAVFANYVLDSLPVALLHNDSGTHKQLCIRMYLPAQLEEEIKQRTGLTCGQIVDLAASQRAEDRARLLPLLPFFEFEGAYRSDGTGSLPYLAEVVACGAGSRYLVLSYGAIQCLEACLSRLHTQGFVLFNDFGPSEPDQVDAVSYLGRFGSSVAVSVNFPLLEHHFSSSGRTFLKPTGDAEITIRARLLGTRVGPGTARAFRERFGDDRRLQADRLASEAIEHINAGRFDDALECYKTALRHCPNDWHLLGQAAQFLTQQLLRHREALELGQAALAINPWYSAFLWNTAGNSLFCLGEYDEAHQAFLRAQAIDPDDPQTNLNLAYTFAQSGNDREALHAVARGLAADPNGRFTSALLTKQRQIIDALAGRRAAEQHRLDQRHTVFTTAR